MWGYYFWKHASKAKYLHGVTVSADNFQGLGGQKALKRVFIIIIIITIIIISIIITITIMMKIWEVLGGSKT